MPATSSSPRKKGPFHRLAHWYAKLSYHRPWIPLLLIALSVFGSVQLAKNLRIDTDLRVLLPEGTPSKWAIEEAERRRGSTDLYTVAFESPSIEAVARFQRDLADSIQHWPEVIWSQYDQDRSFFEDRALLYLPAEELEDLYDRVSEMVGDEFAAANPLIESLFDEGEREKRGLEGWPDAESLRREGLPEDIVTALLAKAGRGDREEEESAAAPPSRVDDPEDPPKPDSLEFRLINWHASKQVWVGVVLTQLNQPSTDAAFAKSMYDRGEALIASMHPEEYHPELVARVAGAFRNFNEIDQVNADVVAAGVISLVLVTLLLLVFVRKPLNLLLINLPLFTAMAWAMAVTFMVYQRLTMLTAFILSLILGLGIDYAVHLYARWTEEMRRGRQPIPAMTRAMTTTGRALLASAATSIIAMLSLQMGHFEGFREFGVVVSLGIFFALIASWIVTPPLFFLAVRGTAWLGRHVSRAPTRWAVRRLLPSGAHGARLLPRLNVTPRAMKVLAASAAVLTVAVSFAPPVDFENDFRNLRGPSTGAGISYGRAVGAGQNTSPAVILGQSEAQMRAVHEGLAARYGVPADSMLHGFMTIQSFVPRPALQRERKEIMVDILSLINARALERVDSATRADLDSLRRYLHARPFTFDSLPGWSQRFLTEADGSTGKMGFLYAKMRESDAVESALFQDRFQFLPARGDTVPVASSGFIYADVVRMVKQDGPVLAIATILLLLLITAIDMRRWRGVVIVVGFLLLTSWWTYSLMGLLGFKLGVFNLVVIPTVLAVSVDAVIHLYHRRLALGAGRIGELYHGTGSAVLVGALTNFFGFFGLCFVAHKGMQSIGFLACLGIGSGILVMFTALPAALEYLCPKDPVEEDEDAYSAAHGDVGGGS